MTFGCPARRVDRDFALYPRGSLTRGPLTREPLEVPIPNFELFRPIAGLTEKSRWCKQMKTSRLKTGTGLAALLETIE